MSRKRPAGNPLPDLVVQQRQGQFRSGAAGVHADQKARTYATGRTNRVGSRSARTRAAIKHEES